MSYRFGFDYYEVLGLSRDCTLVDIKKAFKKLAIIYHPDKNQVNSKECEEKFKQIAEAYSVLSDPKKRKKYDTYGDSEYEGGDHHQHHHGFQGKFGDFTYDRAEEIFRDFFRNEGLNAPKMSKSHSHNQPQNHKQENKREGSHMFAEDDSSFLKDPFFRKAFSNFEPKPIGEGYKGQSNYRSFKYTIPSKPRAPGSTSVTTSTIIRNGKKIVVTQTTHHNEDGTKKTEVHERVEDAGQSVHEHRYVNHHGMAEIGYDPDQDRRN